MKRVFVVLLAVAVRFCFGADCVTLLSSAKGWQSSDNVSIRTAYTLHSEAPAQTVVHSQGEFVALFESIEDRSADIPVGVAVPLELTLDDTPFSSEHVVRDFQIVPTDTQALRLVILTANGLLFSFEEFAHPSSEVSSEWTSTPKALNNRLIGKSIPLPPVKKSEQLDALDVVALGKETSILFAKSDAGRAFFCQWRVEETMQGEDYRGLQISEWQKFADGLHELFVAVGTSELLSLDGEGSFFLHRKNSTKGEWRLKTKLKVWQMAAIREKGEYVVYLLGRWTPRGKPALVSWGQGGDKVSEVARGRFRQMATATGKPARVVPNREGQSLPLFWHSESDSLRGRLILLEEAKDRLLYRGMTSQGLVTVDWSIQSNASSNDADLLVLNTNLLSEQGQLVDESNRYKVRNTRAQKTHARWAWLRMKHNQRLRKDWETGKSENHMVDALIRYLQANGVSEFGPFSLAYSLGIEWDERTAAAILKGEYRTLDVSLTDFTRVLLSPPATLFSSLFWGPEDDPTTTISVKPSNFGSDGYGDTPTNLKAIPIVKGSASEMAAAQRAWLCLSGWYGTSPLSMYNLLRKASAQAPSDIPWISWLDNFLSSLDPLYRIQSEDELKTFLAKNQLRFEEVVRETEIHD